MSETTNQEVRKIEVPEWVQEIKRKYMSQNVSQFIVHGNLNDFVQVKEEGEARYMKLKEFFNNEMFKQRDIVVYYDRASGIRFKDDRIFGGQGKMRQDFISTLKMFDDLSGNSFSNLSRDPARAFLSLDTYFNLCVNEEFIEYLIRYLKRRLSAEMGGRTSSPKTKAGKSEQEMDIVERFMNKTIPDLLSYMDRPEETKTPRQSASEIGALIKTLKDRLSKPKSIAFMIDYAETIIPMAESSQYRPEERMLLVFLQKWAKEPTFLGADITFVVLTENVADVNAQYVRNPYTHSVEVPYPDESARFDFIETFFKNNQDAVDLFEMKEDVLAKNTAGLGLVHLNIMMSEVKQNQLTFSNEELMKKKKEMIEAEAGGLLEFVESKYSLEHVAGHAQAKKHLKSAAKALKTGRPDVMPMGYLVSGPVGTGKTFMITCFANDIGVPMVLLKNFRSQWQGVTEGNLQKVLKILKAMSPVAVMIDEADAYLGNRNSSGDSGVSSRVFSMIASFMSNTDHRGKIIWFLVTARPDLMPVDFKRQGRAEEHIALFYPESIDEKKELFSVMLKKTGMSYLDIEEFDDMFFEDLTIKSGADMEAALTRAKFKAASFGREKVDADIVAQVFADFLPPTYPEEIELMNYAAVLECTSRELLPPRFKNLSRQEVLEIVQDLKMRIR